MFMTNMRQFETCQVCNKVDRKLKEEVDFFLFFLLLILFFFGRMKRLKLDNEWRIEAVLNDDVASPKVPLSKALVVIVEDKKTISTLVKILGKHLPMQPHHLFLKRVNGGRDDARIIVAIEDSETASALTEASLQQNLGEDAWQELLKEGIHIPLLQTEVPASAPLTRAQFKYARSFWPCHFHEDKRLEALLGNSTHVFSFALFLVLIACCAFRSNYTTLRISQTFLI